MTHRRTRPFALPGFVGRRLVGTVEEVAGELGASREEVARVVAAARLDAWGTNSRGERVWRVRDAARALGFPEPERPRRGAPQFRLTIPGSRGRRRSRQELAGDVGDLDAAGGPQEPLGGRGPSFEEV